MLTKQEVFDKVWDHFVVKGSPRSEAPDWSGDGTCRFRQDRTAACPVRCAVGLFIPDDVYVPGMDDGCSSAADLRDRYDLPPEVDELFEEHAELFRALQAAHDSTVCAADLPAALRSVAHSYKLTVPTVDSPPSPPAA